MTVAASGPVFSLQEIPFSYRGSWFGFSPVIAEKTYAEDVHLVSHQTGMHPILRLIPHAASRRTHHRHARPAHLEPRRRPIDLAYESLTPCVSAGPVSGCACGGRPGPDALQRSVLLPRSRRRLVRLHRLPDRPPLPGHPPRRTAAEHLGAQALGTAERASRPSAANGRSPSRSTRPPVPPTSAATPSSRWPRPHGPSSTRSSTRSRRGAAIGRRPPNWPPTCCGRPPCARRVRHPACRAHVQALDGQGVELGPLLQRHRPRRGPARAGLGPVPAALRPPGRRRGAARLRDSL